MLLIEKDSQKAEDQSTSPNSENDFKELIDEIDKVLKQNSSNSETEQKSNELNVDSNKIQKEAEEKNFDNTILSFDQNENKIRISNEPNQIKINTLDENQSYKNNVLLNKNINNNNRINNYFKTFQLNNINIAQNNNAININQENSNQNNFQTNLNNNSYYNTNIYGNNNSNNFVNKNSFNNYFKNCGNINRGINNGNLMNSQSNCFNYNVNNSLLISILKNQILNDIQKQQIQGNFLGNLNILYNCVNNIGNNNNLNILLQNEIRNQLINLVQNYKNGILNLLLLKSISNNKLNDYINPSNFNPKIKDLNCFNINNININNQIQLNPQENDNFNQINISNAFINLNTNNLNNFNSSDNQTQTQTNIAYSNNKKSSNIYSRKKFKNKTPIDISKNQINLMNIIMREDNRTTLMIKNIPNKYTISSFLEEIDTYFKNTYDVFYLPIDYVNKCNLGFAFINFVEPLHIILFYELYRGKKWKKFKSDKKCELLYAKFQNKKELTAHFEKGKVLLFDTMEKRPLILPTPKILPKINIPLYYLNIFTKMYPNVSYNINVLQCLDDKQNYNEICKDNNYNNNKTKDNSNITFVFSIDGNFIMNNNK